MALQGIDYVTSAEKLERDEQFGRLIAPVAAFIEERAASALADRLTPGADAYFNHERMGQGDEVFTLPKLRTMRDDVDAPADSDLAYSKNNPRIAGRLARLFRDLAIDELPQIQLLPQLSLVGPRSIDPGFFDHWVRIGENYDKGLTKDWVEIMQHPLIRDGLSGVAQIRWQWYNHRNPELLIKCMRDEVRYYLETASAHKDSLIIASTPFIIAASALAKRLHKPTTS